MVGVSKQPGATLLQAATHHFPMCEIITVLKVVSIGMFRILPGSLAQKTTPYEHRLAILRPLCAAYMNGQDVVLNVK